VKKGHLVLACLLIVGAFLRFYNLGEIPAGLHRDEAFLGYNAYSILKTGRDMSGNFLPLHLKSFLYSPAGYSYFALPPLALFGLNTFAVRFPSALFGTVTVLLVYLLSHELFKKSLLTSPLPLFASALVALSPWHINLSRVATENVIVTCFIVLGTLLYVISSRKQSVSSLLLSFISFSLTLTLYQAPRAFLPLFIPLLILTHPPAARTNRQSNRGGVSQLKPFILYVLMIMLPTLLIMSNPLLSLRIRTVSLVAHQNTQLSVDEFIREDGVAGSSRLTSRIFHNKLSSYSLAFLQNYASHFSYDFLFTDKGLPDRYRIPNQGLLYITEIPLIFLGLLRLLTYPSKEGALLLGWLLLAPIGSALAFDDIPNLQRTVFMQPVFAIVSAVGLSSIIGSGEAFIAGIARTPSRGIRMGLVTAGIALSMYSFAFFLHQYFTHMPIHKPWYRHEGYEQLVSAVNTLLPSYQKAVITNRESAPAIFFLFFGTYDPVFYLRETAGKQIHDYDRADFGPYEFSQEECPLRVNPKTGNLTGQPNVLYVNYGTCPLPGSATVLEEIRRGDNSTVFKVVTVKT